MTLNGQRGLKLLLTATSIAVILGFIAGCGSDDTRTVVSFWHFWSEPRQRAVLDSLVESFELDHPNIDVQTTVLSWNDGKSKLQMAFNAGNPPDLIHLGMDWFAEFDGATSFIELPSELATDTKRSNRWLVNARAMVVNTTSSDDATIGGLCVSDPHNVIKRVLPLLWQRGSQLYQRLPISDDLQDTLASALWSILESSPGAIRDRSRKLDELLLRGKISSVLTGTWIIDMASDQHHDSLRVRPMRSILNADVMAIPASTQSRQEAILLLGHLSSYESSRQFCHRVSDAGFPADLDRAIRDPLFNTNTLQKGFLETARLSQPMVHSAKLLSIEPVIETMLERSYGARSREEIRSIVGAARAEVRKLESR